MTLCRPKLSGSKKRAGGAILEVPVRTPSSILFDKLNWTLLSGRKSNNLRTAVFR